MKRPFLAGGLAAAVLVGSAVPAFGQSSAATPTPGGIGWNSVPVASSASDQMDCKAVLFVGVRGSGETATKSTTLGPLSAKLGAGKNVTDDVRQVWLDYPAVALRMDGMGQLENLLLNPDPQTADYSASVAAGTNELSRLLVSNVERCPDERVVVAGYSQGAEVVVRGVNKAVKEQSKVAEQLLDVLLLGNPTNYVGQDVQQPDSTAKDAYGASTSLSYLREAGQLGKVSREQSLRNIVQATFNIYDGKIDQDQLGETIKAEDFVIDPAFSKHVYSVCGQGDMVCDTIPTLVRILSAETSPETEWNDSRPVHSNYPNMMPKTIRLVSADIAQAQQTAKQRAAEKAEQEQRDKERQGGARPGWLIPTIIGAVALVALVAMLGALIRRGRRREP